MGEWRICFDEIEMFSVNNYVRTYRNESLRTLPSVRYIK